MNSDIQFLVQLRKDLAEVATMEAAASRRRQPRREPRLRLLVGAAVLVPVFLVSVVVATGTFPGAIESSGSPAGGAGSSTPSASQQNGLPYAPLGSNPFHVGGKQVTEAEAETEFASAAPASAGALVQPHSFAARPGTITHVWIGPWSLGLGASSLLAKEVVFEYGTGIRVSVAPALNGSPMTPEAAQAAFESDAKTWGQAVGSVESIDGVPAEILHGDGSTIQTEGGTEAIDGTQVSFYLKGLYVRVWADHSVAESAVLSAASSVG